jgi:hypothetical protein
MPQFDDYRINSPLDDLSSELNEQKKQGIAFKIAFFTLFTIIIVVVVWQVTKNKQKEVKNDLEKNSELK